MDQLLPVYIFWIVCLSVGVRTSFGLATSAAHFGQSLQLQRAFCGITVAAQDRVRISL